MQIGQRVNVNGKHYSGGATITSIGKREGVVVSVAVQTDKPFKSPAGRELNGLIFRGHDEVSKLSPLFYAYQVRDRKSWMTVAVGWSADDVEAQRARLIGDPDIKYIDGTTHRFPEMA